MQITIHTPTSKLEDSNSFYKRLNYKQLSDSNPCLWTDGKSLIEINPDRFARPGIKIYGKKSWEGVLESLKKMTPVHEVGGGYLLNDSNGCWIYLVEETLNVPEGSSDDIAVLTGNFAGLSLETSDMHRSLEFWKLFGLKVTMGGPDKGFVVLMNDEGFGVSLMNPMACPHLFFNPSMTFFNGKDNLKLIEQIREANIPIAEEITHFNKEGIVDNIIIRDPGGYGFFIFSD